MGRKSNAKGPPAMMKSILLPAYSLGGHLADLQGPLWGQHPE
jgi:hypothetical protein